MKAVVVEKTGGPENLYYGEVPDQKAGPGEVLVKLEAIGVNFIDTYFRNGLYQAPEKPIRIGSEGAGTIVEVGEGAGFQVGQRVAYVLARGSYAQYAAVPQRYVVKLPPDISFQQGAAAVLQGLTAHYLTRSTFPLQAGQVCLVHAAAGGTGQMIVQAAKIAGATVIGTCSTKEKAELAKQCGADHVIRYDEQDFAAETKKITAGAGVDVVYDSVGKTTFAGSLDCLKPRGLMVSFGNASGPVGEIAPLLLMQKGSLYLTRPHLENYIAGGDLEWRSSELFQWISEGKLKVGIFKEYSLSDAGSAHRDLEARRSTGKLILLP